MTETKQHIDKKKVFDVVVAILLALAALGTAWATWMSQLHGSNEAQNYATSSALRVKGGSALNNSSMELSAALTAWNDLVALDATRKTYEAEGETSAATLAKAQMEYIITSSCDERTEKIVREALAKDPVPNPFTEEVMKQYYQEAQGYLDEAEELIQAGNRDNLLSDAFAFVNLLYSIVLFLLAYMNIVKDQTSKNILLTVSVIAFIGATIYMFSLPMPTGFDFNNYLQFLNG